MTCGGAALQDREFSLAGGLSPTGGAEAASISLQQQQQQQKERQTHLEQLMQLQDRGFQAAFGDILMSSKPLPAQTGQNTAAPLLEPRSKRSSRWQDLFDSPSHVLPPLSQLCPAFLELAIADRERGRSLQ